MTTQDSARAGSSGRYRLALHLLRHPHTGWNAIAAQPIAAGALIMRLIVPGSLACALAVTAGITWFNRDWNPDFGYSPATDQALSIGLATLVLSVAYALVLAAVFTRIGKMYGSRDGYAHALALVAYGTLPVWISGAFMFLLPAALLGMLNSCAANVTVVNIDAGFKAGYVAGLIARRANERV